MKTTYVERTNTNKEVFRRANELIKDETAPEKKPKIIVPFVTCYLNSRIKRLIRLNKMDAKHPVRHITFGTDRDNRLVPWTPSNRRIGRPRYKWVTEAVKDMWQNITSTHAHIPPEFDNNNIQQHEAVKNCMSTEAPNPTPVFK